MIGRGLKGLAGDLLEALPGPARRAARRAYYARLLRSATEADEVDLPFLKEVVAAGDRVVDAGASIGIYTRFLSALVGPSGAVHAVEPVPETFDVLASNVRRLGLANVRPIRCALSDFDGEVEMEVPRWPHGGENLYEARVRAQGAPSALRRVRVEARRLDSLLTAQEPIAFVKCDVEGHELACLRGAEETVRRWRPAWLLEVWGDPDDERSHAREVFRAMERLGYGAYCAQGGRLAARVTGRRTANYWFLAPGHVHRLRDRGRV